MKRIRLEPSTADANQGELFQCDDGERPQMLLEEQGSIVDYWPNFLSRSSDWFASLEAEIPWQQHHVRLFGRELAAPRLSSWHGDRGASYRYSGTRYEPQPWTPTLARIRAQLERELGVGFNAVLANRYKDGNDAMGWHCDDEPELGSEPVIASISLGASRDFQLKRKLRGRAVINLALADRSLLIMRGHCQRDWLHGLPRRKGVTQARINLTFRLIEVMLDL